LTYSSLLYVLAQGRFCTQAGSCHYFCQEAIFRLSRLTERHESAKSSTLFCHPLRGVLNSETAGSALIHIHSTSGEMITFSQPNLALQGYGTPTSRFPDAGWSTAIGLRRPVRFSSPCRRDRTEDALNALAGTVVKYSPFQSDFFLKIVRLASRSVDL
jgi:hypothetical protein